MKKVGLFSYFLPSNINHLNTLDKNFLKIQLENFSSSIEKEDYNIIKFRDQQTFSLLKYDGLGEIPFPKLAYSYKFNKRTNSFIKRDFTHRQDRLILHRQETILGETHKSYVEMLKLTSLLENIGAFDETFVIGSEKRWKETLQSLNVKIEKFNLVPTDKPSSNIPRHKTAIARYGFSKPIKKLLDHGLIDIEKTIFDFGCGLGDDIRLLNLGGFQASGWDPYFFPNNKKKASDIVNLGFVLNVIESPNERVKVIKEAFSFTKKVLSIATIQPRRDSAHVEHQDGTISTRNTFQKYFSQTELKELIEASLDKKATPVAPGLFFIFKEELDEQEFFSNRIKTRKATLVNSVVLDTDEDQALSDEFFSAILDKKSIKRLDQLPVYLQSWVEKHFSSMRKAINWHLNKVGKDIYEKHQKSADDNLILQASFLVFRQIKTRSLIEHFDINEIYARFKNPKNFLSKAMNLLSKIADKNALGYECYEGQKNSLLWSANGDDFYMSTSTISALPVLLQLYIEISDFFLGDISDSDVIKISLSRNSLSHYKYEIKKRAVFANLKTKRTIKLPFGQEWTWQDIEPSKQKLLVSDQFIFGEINKGLKNKQFLTLFKDQYKPHLDCYKTKDRFALYGNLIQQKTYLHFCRENNFLTDDEIYKSFNNDKVMLPDLKARCGKYLRFSDFFTAGETAQASNLYNVPKNIETYRAFEKLSENIIDKVIQEFGRINLTYGFCSKELERNILKKQNPGIAPKIDQHASCEKTIKGTYICSRKGAAADFFIENINMLDVAQWIVKNCTFDRLYFYGSFRPIHTSFGPENKNYIAMMESHDDKRIPKTVSEKKFLSL